MSAAHSHRSVPLDRPGSGRWPWPAGGGTLRRAMDLERLYREESGRILATLIRLAGEFDLAEEAVQDAFAAALERWAGEGPPANPGGWLMATARNKPSIG